jgi:hypothetical protein
VSYQKDLYVYKLYLPAETQLAEGQWLEEQLNTVKLRMSRTGTRMPTVSRTERRHLAPLETFIKKKHERDDICCEVSENCDVSSIIMICQVLKKSTVTKGYKFSLYEFKFIEVIIHFNSIHVYLRANLTAQRPITRLAQVHRNTHK